jgi:hypothetical protein
VNKSLEQGIVTEDLAAKGATAYKTSDIGDWQSLTCNFQNVSTQKLSKK